MEEEPTWKGSIEFESVEFDDVWNSDENKQEESDIENIIDSRAMINIVIDEDQSSTTNNTTDITMDIVTNSGQNSDTGNLTADTVANSAQNSDDGYQTSGYICPDDYNKLMCSCQADYKRRRMSAPITIMQKTNCAVQLMQRAKSKQLNAGNFGGVVSKRLSLDYGRVNYRQQMNVDPISLNNRCQMSVDTSNVLARMLSVDPSHMLCEQRVVDNDDVDNDDVATVTSLKDDGCMVALVKDDDCTVTLLKDDECAYSEQRQEECCDITKEEQERLLTDHLMLAEPPCEKQTSDGQTSSSR